MLRWLLAVAAALVLVGCTGSDGASSDTTALDSVDSVLEVTSTAMGEVDSVKFTIEQTGADLFIDDDELLRFTGAVGRYRSPSSSDALISVAAGTIAIEVGAVAIDGEIWLSNPLTGGWGPAPEDFSFDPTVLFDADVGWSDLLSVGVTDPELVASGEDGEGRHHVRATVDAARVSILTGGLIDEESVIDLWIDATTNQVAEGTFDTGVGEKLRSWRLLLTDYGAAVEITRPELDTDS